LADDVVKLAPTPFAVVENSLVDHIPALDPSLVAGHDGMDMLAHTFDQHLAGYVPTVFAFKKPGRCLRMPDQRMTDQAHAMFFAIFHKAVGILEVKLALTGLQVHGFHAIFGG